MKDLIQASRIYFNNNTFKLYMQKMHVFLIKLNSTTYQQETKKGSVFNQKYTSNSSIKNTNAVQNVSSDSKDMKLQPQIFNRKAVTTV